MLEIEVTGGTEASGDVLHVYKILIVRQPGSVVDVLVLNLKVSKSRITSVAVSMFIAACLPFTNNLNHQKQISGHLF